jgi:hypothetical protein
MRDIFTVERATAFTKRGYTMSKRRKTNNNFKGQEKKVHIFT